MITCTYEVKVIEIYGSKKGKKIKLENFGINQKAIETLNDLIKLHKDLKLIIFLSISLNFVSNQNFG